MTRLINLKKWLTLNESVSYLSAVLKEAVTVADLLSFGVDGHLRLSANFVNGAPSIRGKPVKLDDARLQLIPINARTAAEAVDFPNAGTREEQVAWLEKNPDIADSGNYRVMIDVDRISESDYIEWEREITSIDGVWDLPMIGGGYLDIEHERQKLIGGPAITKVCLDGVLVQSVDGLQYARIMEHFSKNEFCEDRNDRAKYSYRDRSSYYPADRLPDDAPVVVRTEELTGFVSRIANAEYGASESNELPKDTPGDIDPRSRTSYLRIIRALVQMQGVKRRGASMPIQRQLEELGFSGPKEATIRRIVEDAMALEPDKPQ